MRSELDQLRDRVDQLEDMLGLRVTFPPSMGLTRTEQSVLGVLLIREVATYEMIMYALYGDRPDADRTQDNIRVYIKRLRSKLDERVDIRSSWGIGYWITAAGKRALRSMVDEERRVAA